MDERTSVVDSYLVISNLFVNNIVNVLPIKINDYNKNKKYAKTVGMAERCCKEKLNAFIPPLRRISLQ